MGEKSIIIRIKVHHYWLKKYIKKVYGRFRDQLFHGNFEYQDFHSVVVKINDLKLNDFDWLANQK